MNMAREKEKENKIYSVERKTEKTRTNIEQRKKQLDKDVWRKILNEQGHRKIDRKNLWPKA